MAILLTFFLALFIGSHAYNAFFKWTNPFQTSNAPPPGFEAACSAEATFQAKQYTVSDLDGAWLAPVQEFLARHTYPGDWEGHGAGDDNNNNHNVVVAVEYADVPEAVKTWVEEQYEGWTAEQAAGASMKKWHLFGVFEKPVGEQATARFVLPGRDTAVTVAEAEEQATRGGQDREKVLVFAPAAIYEILPLWVAKGSGCENDLLDLTKYDADAKEGGVVAWPIERTAPNEKSKDPNISLKIRAYVTRETEEAKAARKMFEHMYKTIRRQTRKQEKEERRKKKKELARDEL